MHNQYIVDKMEDQKEAALTTLSLIFPNYTNEMATMLARCYFDEMDSAEKISSNLNLGTLDFCAILGDYKNYKEEFLNDLDLQLQEEAYERSIRYA